MESGEVRQRTLKEKIKEHYHTHPPNFRADPKEASKVGVAYFAGMLITLLIEGVFILIPANYDGDFYSVVFYEVLAIVIFVETAMNWYRTWYDVANFVRKSTKQKYFEGDETPEGWKHCFTCQLDAPPRSHHCTICNRCMLKRDHHCFFTSSCIGFQNQKYFIFFCFYVIVGTFLAVYQQLIYLHKTYPINTSAVIHYFPILTIFDWITGAISFSTLLLCIHMIMTLMCGMMCALFVSWQMLLIICGKTSYEAKRGLHTYNLGTLDNLRAVFGPLKFCGVLFLAPMSLPQLGDGIKWKTNKKTHKSF